MCKKYNIKGDKITIKLQIYLDTLRMLSKCQVCINDEIADRINLDAIDAGRIEAEIIAQLVPQTKPKVVKARAKGVKKNHVVPARKKKVRDKVKK